MVESHLAASLHAVGQGIPPEFHQFVSSEPVLLVQLRSMRHVLNFLYLRPEVWVDGQRRKEARRGRDGETEQMVAPRRGSLILRPPGAGNSWNGSLNSPPTFYELAMRPLRSLKSIVALSTMSPSPQGHK